MTRTVRSLGERFRQFLRDEHGSMAIHGLFTFVTCCIIGSVGLDVTHFYAAKTQLQVAADIAAHTALYARHHDRTEEQAKTDAIMAVQYGMPVDTYGTVLTTGDIVFGHLDGKGDLVPLAPGSSILPTAVKVDTSRAGKNPVGSFLFRLVGVSSMDVAARAVFVAEPDRCSSMQGLFAVGTVTPNSNNTFSEHLCAHSQGAVRVQNNPTFAPGSYVSAPSASNVTCQNKCSSFDAARRTATYDLSPYYAPLQGGTSGPELLNQVERALPDWDWTGISRAISSSTATTMSAAASVMNRVNYVNCAGANLTLSGTWTKTVLLLNNCKVLAGSDLILSDSILYNTNLDDRTSFNFGSGRNAASLVLGQDTDCNGSGAAAILTRGGFDAPAKMTFNNGTIIARGNVKFAAQFGGADGAARGLSVIAAGSIDTTSNSSFTACPPLDAAPKKVSFHLAH